jgi:hypothetical protein
MMRKLILAAGVGTMLLLGAPQAALAADAPTDVAISYGPGTRADQVALKVNLPQGQQAGVSEYDIRVEIAGQPSRSLIMKDPEAILFNVMPGTKVHAYVQLKGDDFGTSQTYDGGTYTQPSSFNPNAAPATPAASASPTPQPSASDSPSASSSPTPAPSTLSPSPSATPTRGSQTPTPSTTASTPPGEVASDPENLASFISSHIGGILAVMVIALVLAGAALALVRRNRRR